MKNGYIPIPMKKYTHPDLAEVTLAEAMQALSDPCRLTIVRALMGGGELACNEIPLKISKATRSHHFDILRASGIIRSRCEGTKCLTSLRKRELNQRFPGLLKLVAAGS